MGRTWGRIRYEAQRAVPGGDLELIDGYIRDAYQEILAHRHWSELLTTAVLTTFQRYGDGTVTLTKGSAVVTGAGTTFPAASAGRRFRLASESEWFDIALRDSDTQLTLARDYTGETASGVAYWIFDPTVWLPADALHVERLTEMHSNREIKRTTQPALDAMDAARTTQSTAFSFWAPHEPAVDGTRRIEVWPAPIEARALEATYRLDPVEFTGSNTDESPLAFVSTAAILARVKELALRDAKDHESANFAAAEFDRHLRSMDKDENRRVGPSKIRMAAEHTHLRSYRR